MAPKSNAVYKAYNQMKAFVKKDSTRAVPLKLRNAPTKLMGDLGYGTHYRYAHDEEGAFAAGEKYFPDPRGLEIKIGERLKELQRLNQEARVAQSAPEGLKTGNKYNEPEHVNPK